jgi:hypothetical protein
VDDRLSVNCHPEMMGRLPLNGALIEVAGANQIATGQPLDECLCPAVAPRYLLRHHEAPPAHVRDVVSRATVILGGDEGREIRRACVVAEHCLENSQKCALAVPAGAVKDE